MASANFSGFRRAFAADPDFHLDIDADELAMNLSMVLGIETPSPLVDFWREIGGGYFGNRRLHVFGDAVLEWNTLPYWRRIFPPAKTGGPVFFAETCFGLQIGFRWKGDAAVGCLFDIDTMTPYPVDGDLEQILEREFCDPELLESVSARLGPLPKGMHYAPIVTPLVGGRLDADNYKLETPGVHLRTTFATWESLQQLRKMNQAG